VARRGRGFRRARCGVDVGGAGSFHHAVLSRAHGRRGERRRDARRAARRRLCRAASRDDAGRRARADRGSPGACRCDAAGRLADERRRPQPLRERALERIQRS
jgi:hypothetical protein